MAANSANKELASEEFKDFNLGFVAAKSATSYMSDGYIFRCHCSHEISLHSRKYNPAHGQCISPGCHCQYFKPYRHVSQEVQT